MHRPQRLNLALARGCFVRCRGCYTFFGNAEPDLGAFTASVRRFVALGVDRVTLSGGDPLTLRGLPEFLEELRGAGVTSIKLDTVGTSLITGRDPVRAGPRSRQRLLSLVDMLGLPLDGWSNQTVTLFRKGRAELFDETTALLDALDEAAGPTAVVINTLVHRLNIKGLSRIMAVVASHPCVNDWSIFQYTPTDQAADGSNREMAITDHAFVEACEAIRERLQVAATDGRTMPRVQFRSLASRFGDYLLINSDGEAWLPDEHGQTVALGVIFGRESEVLDNWASAVRQLVRLKKSLPGWVPSRQPARVEMER